MKGEVSGEKWEEVGLVRKPELWYNVREGKVRILSRDDDCLQPGVLSRKR